MDIIRTFHKSVLGASHKYSKKPCQDASLIYENINDKIYICVVSDGHGGDLYFRSDKGSRFITEITVNKILEYINGIKTDLSDTVFTAVSARTTKLKVWDEDKSDNCEKEGFITDIDRAFRLLFSSLISEWNDKIAEDWYKDTPTREEMEALKVPESSINDFLKNIDIEKAYGCTLIAFAQTSTYWFAFQIGDGKCILFDENGNWEEPIPWDENCIGSITTSLCEPNTIDSFRYCYSGKDLPVAIFLSSDGLDDSFNGDLKELSLLYNVIIREFIDDGFERTIEDIVSYLPKLSEKGSRDDMSIAGLINLIQAKQIYPFLIKKEMQYENEKLDIINSTIEKKESITILKQAEIENKVQKVKKLESDITKSEKFRQKIEKELSERISKRDLIQNEIDILRTELLEIRSKLRDEEKLFSTEKSSVDKLKSEKKSILKKIRSLDSDLSKHEKKMQKM